MKRGSPSWYRWFVLLLFPALILTGCAVSPPSAASSAPDASRTQALLTTVQAVVKRLRDSNQVTTVQPNDAVDVIPKDRVAIEDKGRALLKFPDGLDVELLRNGELQVDEVRVEPAGFVFVRLKQAFGHSRTLLESQAKARVELDTDFATITALTDNTGFMVCHAPGVLTCMVTLQGEAEVRAQGQSVTVRGGEATYILKDEAPKPALCARQDEVRAWLDRMRGTTDSGDLGSLVISWPQQPCSASGTGRAAPPATPEATATGVQTPPAGETPSYEQTAAPEVTPTEEAAPTEAGGYGQAPTPESVATETPEPTPESAATLPSDEGMVKIPAGSYTVGVPAPDDNHLAQQKTDVPEFWIDQNLVTNAQYKAFLDATGRPAPATWKDGALPAGREKRPIDGLTWDDAATYCSWAGKRLPGEAEWEIAARGPGDNPPLYPWGSDPTAGGQVSYLPRNDTYDTGSMAFNKSPFEVYDLTGQVWQWVGDGYGPVPDGMRILRGGRHGFLQDSAYRQPARPDDARFTRVAGVRCAADLTRGG